MAMNCNDWASALKYRVLDRSGDVCLACDSVPSLCEELVLVSCLVNTYQWAQDDFWQEQRQWSLYKSYQHRARHPPEDIGSTIPYWYSVPGSDLSYHPRSLLTMWSLGGLNTEMVDQIKTRNQSLRLEQKNGDWLSIWSAGDVGEAGGKVQQGPHI